MTELTDINCAFSYISSIIFLIGIIVYIYVLVIDSCEEGTRSNSDTVWVWGMFILLIVGFLVSSYCIYGTTKMESYREKWAAKDPFNFIGKSLRPNMPKRSPPLIRIKEP
jgi:predicted membrane channel-forming protein YqfA (hemolysin III family)